MQKEIYFDLKQAQKRIEAKSKQHAPFANHWTSQTHNTAKGQCDPIHQLMVKIARAWPVQHRPVKTEGASTEHNKSTIQSSNGSTYGQDSSGLARGPWACQDKQPDTQHSKQTTRSLGVPYRAIRGSDQSASRNGIAIRFFEKMVAGG